MVKSNANRCSRENTTRVGRALGAALALTCGVALLAPSPAKAWWVGPRAVIVAPPVVVGPPVVYAPPPPVVYAPRRFWVPAHWRGPYWVPGHWAY